MNDEMCAFVLKDDTCISPSSFSEKEAKLEQEVERQCECSDTHRKHADIHGGCGQRRREEPNLEDVVETGVHSLSPRMHVAI
jgi:hypothetical protein